MNAPGRNAPCPCGSGKKYKLCCLVSESVAPAAGARSAPNGAASGAQAIQQALGHHQRGELPQAEALYQRILQAEPHNADALHLLGVLAHQTGRNDVAVDLIGRAISQNGGVPEYYNNLGNVLHRQGDLDAAIGCFQEALRLNLHYPEAHNNRGNVLQLRGDLPGAVACYREALRLRPDYAEAHHNLGNALRGQGEAQAAIGHYREALRFKPDYVEAHNNLGNMLREQGDAFAAVTYYRAALRLRPDYAEAHNNLGNVMLEQGDLPGAIACYRAALRPRPDYAEAHNNLGMALQQQGDVSGAADCYRAALRFKPDFIDALNNLGNVLKHQGDLSGAADCYRAALRLKPDFAAARGNLGVALQEQGDLVTAITYYRAALGIRPDYAEAHHNLAIALQDHGDVPEAITHYREALRLKPDCTEALDGMMHQLQHLCDWSEVEELWARTRRLIHTNPSARISPFTSVTMPSSPHDQLVCARNWVAHTVIPAIQPYRETGFHAVSSARQKLRLGYLSADFHEHATAHLTAELFELHDRDRFEVAGYSLGPDDGSAIRQRLMHGFDRFVDLKDTSYVEAARRIYDDGVDILIDLKGFTKWSRTPILALRPAPIQVNYLAYPGTMGAPFIDYLITDRFVTPPDQQMFFDEQFVYLPDCYQINDRQRKIAAYTPSRAECGLPESGFVFCSFNVPYKITPHVFDVWMRLLRETEGSVLWLLESNQSVAANLRREALARGVAAERLVFAPRRPPAEHLARYRVADLFLDTLPVNAHTTASDALWAGLPVLTCAGESFVSRVAGSLLTAIGLPELITGSMDEYATLALRLAHSPAELAGLRARLADNRLTTPLFDSACYTRHLEDAYQEMWVAWLQRQQKTA